MALTSGAIATALALGVVLAVPACKSQKDGLLQPDAGPDAPVADAPNDVVEAGGSSGDGPGVLDAPAELGPDRWPTGPQGPEDGPVVDPTLDPEPPRGTAGPPALVGCADGTREGFTDFGRWRGVAGCAGGFRVPGLQGLRAYAPQCGREAGNTGANPAGVGCSAADLCAPGWQVCEDPAALAARAPGGCEEAIPEGFALFFLVRSGGSAGGLCVPGSGWQNDLHGCGSFGMPAHETCAPIDRRLTFSLCLATAGIWSCGDADTHLQETALVSKAGPALGGVLCCRED